MRPTTPPWRDITQKRTERYFVQQLQTRRTYVAEPGCHGTIDSVALFPARRHTQRAQRRVWRQRAGAGLIIAEATQVSPRGKGYAFAPGIHADKQVEGWRKVTTAVHEAGGRANSPLTLACRPNIPSAAAARRRPACCPFAHQAQRCANLYQRRIRDGRPPRNHAL